MALGALLVAGGTLYATWTGHLHWYFRVNGNVLVDGKGTSGYLHANTDKTLLLLTRTDQNRRRTYLINLDGASRIISCGEWNPPRFLPLPVLDITTLCSGLDEAIPGIDTPLEKTLVRERTYLEFSTASRHTVKAEW